MMKCRICECTDVDACASPDGCGWVADDLCSTCGELMEYLAAYMIIAGPHDRHTVEHATTAVRRALKELALLPVDQVHADEPLIVLAKP
jgi:hypothetical protein